MSKTQKPETFEKTLERLEALVKTMEEGGQPLEEMLRLYEEGVGLSNQLKEQLQKAQGRLTELSRQGDPVREELPESLL